jgi:hypothetical protein
MADDPTPSVEQADDVVEWGADDEDEGRRDGSPLRGKAAAPRRVFRALTRDPRVVPVIAGLSAVAVFASLVGEWQLVEIQDDPSQPTRQVSGGVAALGAFGTAYLIGAFALTTCVALVLFGRPAARTHARVVGLALAGAVAALLVATVTQLDALGTPFNGYFQFPTAPEATVGRGLEAAFAGIGLAALALYLAGRMPAWAAAEPPAPEPATAVPDAAGSGPSASHDGWRRPRPGPDPDEVPAPLDLSVGPAAPFTNSPDDRV